MEYEYIESITGKKDIEVSHERNILDALAFAVKADIPYLDALEAFYPQGEWFTSWNRIVKRLKKGMTLTDALDIRSIPLYVRKAVAYAEKKGTLPQVLPLLAQNMHMRCFYNYSVSSVFFSSSLLWFILTMSVIFIFPMIPNIFDDLLLQEIESLPDLKQLKWVPFFVITAMVCFILSLSHYAFEFFYLRIPYIGPIVKRRILGELSGMFYCMLAGGADMTEAARTVMEAEPRRWLRRRLKKCIARLEKGENWLDAWEQEIRLETPLSRWLFHSGALTDRVADNFGKLRHMLAEANISAGYRLGIFLEIGVTAVNALLIGFVAYCFFSALILLMNKL